MSNMALSSVNELSMNLTSQGVDDGYLKVLIVAETLVAEVLGNFFAMPNRFCLCLEFDPNCISMRDAIFHIEEKLLHAITSDDTNPVCQDSFQSEPATNSYFLTAHVAISRTRRHVAKEPKRRPGPSSIASG
jgi:hypothetical protein